ncbi:BatD family protein [Kiritimatiellaeota bacterium B1221]|nr:BatD family protein [Kiritimatiellaeota bacterium B1221]
MKAFQKFLISIIIPLSFLHAEVHLELSREAITTDDTVDLLLKFESMHITSIPRLPLPEGLEMVGVPRREAISMYGVSDNRVRYTLRAEKPGTYKIGPFDTNGKAGNEKIKAVTLTVTQAKAIQSTENLFVTMESSADEILVNETVEITLSFYSRVSTGKIQSEDFEENGFEITEFQSVPTRPKRIGGVEYNVERYIAQLTPTKTGNITFDPNFKIQVRERQKSSGSYYAPYSTRIQRIKLKEPLVLKVKNPPEEGRPDDYEGHLGTFRLNASVSPTKVNVGDPITLRVELIGSGSLQQALPPGLSESDDFKVYEPKLLTKSFRPGGRSGQKVIEQVVIPKHGSVTEIPELTFSYYDTTSKSYKTLKSGPFPIEVKATLTADDASIISSLPSMGNSPELTKLGDDLIYLKIRPGKIQSVSTLQPGIQFLGFSSLPFALWAFVGLVVRQKHHRVSDPSNRRRQEAPRRLRKHLRQLEEKGLDIYTRIWDVLSEYLSARLNLPPGELNTQDVSNILQEHVSPETLKACEKWMQKCEQSRFAGNTTHGNRRHIREQFRDFILQLDQELGK